MTGWVPPPRRLLVGTLVLAFLCVGFERWPMSWAARRIEKLALIFAIVSGIVVLQFQSY